MSEDDEELERVFRQLETLRARKAELEADKARLRQQVKAIDLELLKVAVDIGDLLTNERYQAHVAALATNRRREAQKAYNRRTGKLTARAYIMLKRR